MIDELEFRAEQLKALGESGIEDPITYEFEKFSILDKIEECVRALRSPSVKSNANVRAIEQLTLIH